MKDSRPLDSRPHRQWEELDARLADSDDEDGALSGVAEELARFRARGPCPACGGARLRSEALGVTVGDRSIRDLETTVDAVVIRERHEIHSRRAKLVIRGHRIRIAVGEAHLAEEPFLGASAVLGVNVEIGFHA